MKQRDVRNELVVRQALQFDRGQLSGKERSPPRSCQAPSLVGGICLASCKH